MKPYKVVLGCMLSVFSLNQICSAQHSTIVNINGLTLGELHEYAYEAKLVAATIGRIGDLVPSPSPPPVIPDDVNCPPHCGYDPWWRLNGPIDDPTTSPLFRNELADVISRFHPDEITEEELRRIADPGYIDPPPFEQWLHPGIDALVTVGIVDDLSQFNLGFGNYAVLRETVAFEPGAIDAISQESQKTRYEGSPGDGFVLGTGVELLVYDSQSNVYESVLTMELDSYAFDVAEAGDFNFDHSVNGTDLLIAQRAYGGTLSGGALDQWQQGYGDRNGIAGITAVPEPASLMLLVLGSIATACSRTRAPV